MLLIMDPEVRQVFKMRDCITAMERAFAEEARGIAVNKLRAPLVTLTQNELVVRSVSGETSTFRRTI